VAEAVVTDKAIVGTLTEIDPQTGQPKRFITVPLLWNHELADKLAANGVRYTVRVGENWRRASSSSTGCCLSGSCSWSGAGWRATWGR